MSCVTAAQRVRAARTQEGTEHEDYGRAQLMTDHRIFALKGTTRTSMRGCHHSNRSIQFLSPYSAVGRFFGDIFPYQGLKV